MSYRSTRRSNGVLGCIGALFVSALFPVFLLWSIGAWAGLLLAMAIPITLFTVLLGWVFATAWRGVLCPTQWELVVDGRTLRWGEVRRPEMQSVVNVPDIAFVCARCGLDSDKSFLILRSGAQIMLPGALAPTRNVERDLTPALRVENAELVLCHGDAEARSALALDCEATADGRAWASQDATPARCASRRNRYRFSHVIASREDVVRWSNLLVGPDVLSFLLVSIFVTMFVGVASCMMSGLVRAVLAAAGAGQIVVAAIFAAVFLSLCLDWRLRRSLLRALFRFTGACTIHVSDDQLSVEHRDLHSSETICVGRGGLKTLHYQWCPSECAATLTMVVRSESGDLLRHDLAGAIGRKPKAALYRLLQEILVRRGWHVNFESHPNDA